MFVELEPGTLYTLKDNVIIPYISKANANHTNKYKYIGSGMYDDKKYFFLYIKKCKPTAGIYDKYCEFLYKGAIIYIKLKVLEALVKLC